MKYLIMKLYEKKIRERKLKLGINRFSPTKKVVIIILFILMSVSSITLIPLLFTNSRFLIYFDLMIMCFSVITIAILDHINEKINIENHFSEYQEKINILYKILTDDFGITSKDKLEHLIELYKEDINKHKAKTVQNNKFFVFLFSALSGVLSITFTNMGLMGLDFNGWIQFAVFVTFGFIFSIMIVYFLRKTDWESYKYENMVTDLEYVNTTNNYQEFKSKNI